MNNKRFSKTLLFVALGISSFSCYKSYFSEEGFIGIHTSFNPNIKAALLELEVEEIRCDLQLDTGEFCDIILQKEVLDRIVNKVREEPVIGYDIKGNRYESPAFRLPKITIDGCELKDILALEENPKFLEEGCVLWEGNNITENKTAVAGRIGRGILQRHNLFMVLPKGLFFDVTKNRQSFLKDFIEAPCEMRSTGIILIASTELGEMKFLLDSGSNYSLCKLEHLNKGIMVSEKWPYSTQNLNIGDVDFGMQKLYSIDDRLNLPDFDGVLGIDFFISNSIYLDFENHKVYIKRR